MVELPLHKKMIYESNFLWRLTSFFNLISIITIFQGATVEQQIYQVF
jgi:hypothetical protein